MCATSASRSSWRFGQARKVVRVGHEERCSGETIDEIRPASSAALLFKGRPPKHAIELGKLSRAGGRAQTRLRGGPQGAHGRGSSPIGWYLGV